MAIKKNKLSVSTLLMIILLVAILGVSIYIAIVSKGNSGGNGGMTCGATCDSKCQANIAKQVTAALTPVIGKNSCSTNAITNALTRVIKQNACSTNAIKTALTSALTPVIEKNACGETCQKGIACNVLNAGGFVDNSGSSTPETLGDAVVAAINGSGAVPIWRFNRAPLMAASCPKQYPWPSGRQGPAPPAY